MVSGLWWSVTPSVEACNHETIIPQAGIMSPFQEGQVGMMLPELIPNAKGKDKR